MRWRSKCSRAAHVPGKHLFNLWEMRRQLHDHYLRNGRWFKDFLKLRNRTAQARHYARRLSRLRWFSHCESFNKTGARKLYGTYRVMMRPMQLAASCSRVIFPRGTLRGRRPAHSSYNLSHFQTQTCTCCAGLKMTKYRTSPLTLQELTLALQSVNVGSAPGRMMLCGVCYVIY